jgi:hypothetical protein
MKLLNNIKTNLEVFLMEVIVIRASHDINHVHIHVQRPFIYIKGGHKAFFIYKFLLLQHCLLASKRKNTLQSLPIKLAQ